MWKQTRILQLTPARTLQPEATSDRVLANNQQAIHPVALVDCGDNSAVCWLLGDVARLVGKLADRRLSVIGLTRAQVHVLANLRRMGPLTQAALADILEVRNATIARLLDRLEAARWIERRPDMHDRRLKLISMTEKATAVIDEVSVIGHQLRDDMFVDLSQSECEHLVGALATIKSRLTYLSEAP
jgi:MarR family transcriptional regulator for hemolysin